MCTIINTSPASTAFYQCRSQHLDAEEDLCTHTSVERWKEKIESSTEECSSRNVGEDGGEMMGG